MMNSRRTALKKIGAAIVAAPIAPSKALSCMGGGVAPPITIYTAKNYLHKFYIGNMKRFLYRQYKNKWSWSKDIHVISGKSNEKPTIIENLNVTPIQVLTNFEYNHNKVYCSKIDLIYKDKSVDGKIFIIL